MEGYIWKGPGAMGPVYYGISQGIYTMSITNVVDFAQATLDKAFGKNEGYWKYLDLDENLICYVVRKKDSKGKKYFTPYTYQEGKFVAKWYRDDNNKTLPKPLYNLHLLKKYPNCKVLLVEGEKTADAAMELFPEFIALSWMGGSKGVKHLDVSALTGRTVYMLPDNDKTGYDAMDDFRERLELLDCHLHLVDIKTLRVPDKWDVADFDSEFGEVEFLDIYNLILEAKLLAKEPEITQFPDLTNSKKPRPLDTTANFKHLLAMFGITARWNMMNRSRDISVPGADFYYEESENAALTYITNLAVINDLPVRRVDKHLDAIALEQRYHPICDWILSKPLTEPGIFNKFLRCIKTTNDDLSYMLIKRWMISAVTAAFSTGEFAPQGVLVIHGEQYTHKSSFIMSLAPKIFRAIKGGLILDPSKKDDVLTVAQYWIAELAELDATFKVADSNRLKGFVNLEEDSIRRPYAMKDSKLIRRTVFVATVNESKFLIDTTGNRRWWAVSITEPINTYHGLDMQQVWREIYEMYLQGESPNLSRDELILLNNSNEQYEYLDPFSEKLPAAFYWEREPCQWMNATQVLSEIGYEKPIGRDLKRMGDILTKMKLKKGTGRARYSYYMPQRRPPGNTNM